MRRLWHYCWFRDPNKSDTGGKTDQTWPEYTNEGRQVLVLDTGRKLQTQTGLRDRYCQFWSELVPRLVAATEGTNFSLCVVLSFIQDACSMFIKIDSVGLIMSTCISHLTIIHLYQYLGSGISQYYCNMMQVRQIKP